MATPARVYHTQQVHYLRKSVAFDTPNIGSGVPMGTLPDGAIVVDLIAVVETAFNAGTTNVLVVGTASNDDALIDASGVTEATPAGYRDDTGLGYVASGDTEVLVKYTQTGTAATTGAATIIVAYVPNNDG